MASIGHIALGLAASRHLDDGRTLVQRKILFALVCSTISYLPDVDVIGLWLSVPYGASWGHRGATHSIIFAVALSIAFISLGGVLQIPRGKFFVISVFLLLSHGVTDAMTNGGLGVAFFWPVDNTRYFFSWRPIPVSKIGFHFLDTYQLRTFAKELIFFSPIILYLFLPRIGRRRVTQSDSQ